MDLKNIIDCSQILSSVFTAVGGIGAAVAAFASLKSIKHSEFLFQLSKETAILPYREKYLDTYLNVKNAIRPKVALYQEKMYLLIECYNGVIEAFDQYSDKPDFEESRHLLDRITKTLRDDIVILCNARGLDYGNDDIITPLIERTDNNRSLLYAIKANKKIIKFAPLLNEIVNSFDNTIGELENQKKSAVVYEINHRETEYRVGFEVVINKLNDTISSLESAARFHRAFLDQINAARSVNIGTDTRLALLVEGLVYAKLAQKVLKQDF